MIYTINIFQHSAYFPTLSYYIKKIPLGRITIWISPDLKSLVNKYYYYIKVSQLTHYL